MNPNQLFLDKLNQLKQEFAAQLPLRLQAIDDALQASREQPGDEARPHGPQELYRLLHSLGGTAGSFGFTQLGLDARSIESEVAVLMQRGSNWSEEETAQIAQALLRLRLPTARHTQHPPRRLTISAHGQSITYSRAAGR